MENRERRFGMHSVDTESIRKIMKANGFTIVTLATAIGVCKNTMETYLKQPYKMPLGVAHKLIDVLHVSREESTKIFLM